jgi:hypothetical protein
VHRLGRSTTQQAGAGQGLGEWAGGIGRRVMGFALAGEGSGQSL